MAFVEYKGEILPYSLEEKAIEKVLSLEGGYNPKDPVTGQPVNYGIDQRANPDVDVSKLTKEDAKKIYRDKYWKASGADELPEKLALVHFDAAVNQGPEKAKQLLEASGGDVNKYLELRKAEYQRLAEQNPGKYASSLKGWMNRLDSIAADVKPSFEEYDGEILPIAKTKADIEKSREQGLKDIGKTIAAPIISGLASIPEATETMLRGATRNRLGPTGIILNKLLGAPVVPENVYPEAKIEALKDLSTKGEEVAESIRESRSEETKKTIGESKIEGDLFDPSSWSIGEKPSTAGIAYQALEAISSTVPIIATALITKSPTIATGIGGTMGAGDAVKTTRDYISKMSDAELAEKSPEFVRLSEQVGPEKARQIILTKASEDASVAAGLIASIGGNITANLVTGKFDDLLLKSVKNRASRIALGTAGGMTEEGLQELAEGIATDLGIDQYVARKIGTDSFANLILGALGGAGPGGVRGAVAKSSEEKIPKGFEEVSPETEIVPVELKETPVEVATPEEAAKFETAPEIEITGTAETAKAEEAPQLSQDVDYSLAELEGRLPAVEETVAEEPAEVVEEPVAEEVAEPAAETEKVVMFKDYSPEDQQAIRAMEVEKNKIAKEKKLFPEFLRRQGIQPSEKADLGLERISRPGIFKKAAPTFDELTSRAISEGFLLSTGDDVQDVENFREYVRDYVGSGIISTGPDVAREAQIRSIDDAIQEITRKYEKPEFGLEETAPAQLRAEEDKRKEREAEAARIEAEDQAKRDREEIARLSQSSEFALGKTAAEDLMGQKSVFDQEEETPAAPKTMKALAAKTSQLAEDLKDLPKETMSDIEREAMDLADRIESYGESNFATGLRSAVKNGRIKSKANLDFYKKREQDYAARVGKAEEPVSEKLSMANFMEGYPNDKKRLAESKELFETQTSKLLDMTDQYIQDVTDMLNKRGYKYLDVNTASPSDIQELHKKINQMAGSMNLVLKQGEAFREGYDRANEKKLEDAVTSLLKDFGEVDVMIDMEEQAKKSKAEAEKKKSAADEDADIPFFNIERKQTSTPAFKKWFGDSKVVDENGNPLVVYHGTPEEFQGNEFKISPTKNRSGNIDGFYFTPDPDEASEYTEGKDSNVSEGAQVLPVYLSIKNPFVYGSKVTPEMINKFREELLKVMPRPDYVEGKVKDMVERTKRERFAPEIFPNVTFPTDAMQRVLEVGGYDGFKDGRHWVAFYPNQIKSATGNVGTFSTEEADITLNIDQNRKLINKTNEDIREEKIRELQGLSQRKAAAERRFVKGKSKKNDMFNFKVLSEQIDLLSQEIEDLKEEDRRPEAWLKRAGDAIADKKDPISKEVYDVIQAVYKKNPKLLDGLKLKVTKLPEGKSAAGEFKPYSRLVYLYKDTSGIEDPSTIRHELTHTLEQMMPKEAKKALVSRWSSEFKRAYLAEKTDAGKKFFQKTVEMLQNPSTEAFNKAVEAIPTLPDGSQDYRYYQFISPSEYWAVNAEPLMQAYLGTGWQRFKNGVKALFEALKNVFGIRNNSIFYNTFNQVINGPRLNNMMLNNYVSGSIPALNIHRNYLGGQPPLATWDSPEESKMMGVNKSDLIYKLQDKFVDLKDVEKAIRDTSGEIDEKFDAYMKEELYHGRTAERIKDFLREDLLPIIRKLREKGLSIGQFEEYLHNRHAQERNEQIARVNEDMPDGGSGIMTADAQAYMAGLDPKEKATLESVAKDIDQMVKETQDILLDNGLEDAKTINTWRKTYKNYVPLQRDLDIAGGTVSMGGKGYGTKGKESKRATGSEKDVVDILANLAIQRERAIMKSEKARVGRALYGLALKNPNPGFWLPVNPDAIKDPKALAKELQSLGLSAEDAMNFIKEPVTKVVKDGIVTYAPNVNQRFADNVFPVRVNGQDRFIFFNTKDPRAVRLITSLKNIDAQQLAGAIGMTAKVTRFIASMNTQYNPVFGAWNFTRDVGAAMLNLSTTPIADKKAQVLAGTFPALRAIYSDLRAERKEQTKSDREWGKLFEQFKRAGGQTGYRDQFSKTEKKGDVIQREMEYLDRGNVKKTVDAVAGWLSDYNDAMENAVRLSAFKAALDKGLSEDKAASIAKNLTVNFNRKGTFSTGIGALYAFFNASVQGTARLAETLKGPAGKKIMAGGLLLGTFQALALAMYGFDDDEPPEFLKDKNLIIPTGDGKYLIIPMPLGFNAIPATGRRVTEMVLSGGKDVPGKIIDLFGVWVDAFNPIGNGSFAQMLTPTAADPFVSVSMNKDTFGRPISKEDRGTSPTPGFMRSSDRSSEISKYIAEFLNDISSPPGTSYVKGRISPTADELDYIAGQYLGGVGREVQKAAETVKGLFTGEEVEPSRKPIAGKIFGDKESNQAVRAKFYKNVKDMADFESEIKGRKAAKDDTLQEFKDENPESRLWKKANDVENRISEINQKISKYKAKKEDQEYYKERVKDLEDKKIEIMRNFNERVKEEK